MMRAMLIKEIGPITDSGNPLIEAQTPIPEPSDGQIRIKISACGVCHTELDEIEGRTGLSPRNKTADPV